MLSGEPQNSVDHFTYLSHNISSTESDINICWLSIIQKSDQSDKIKLNFFQVVTVYILLCTKGRPTKSIKKKLDGNYTRKLCAILKKIQEATPHKTASEHRHLPTISQNIQDKQDICLVQFGLVWFYCISTIVGYFMPYPIFTFVLNIYDLVWLGFMLYQLLQII